ncbi:helix-turn-helix transcriptional regulator [Clostridium niameyense]|uniref:Helix-turn-helix transcriptional regulator n=1 Tax=Clostridium niameyense TaxID=1622073 RepID=A0A6M0RBV8_9CLOT|nr:helix-turn-helix transcriptional regulator [Clostridium niameyense]NEZ47693.1 helix-turn-helix transcriptional regulator [Clostridium niameyense]
MGIKNRLLQIRLDKGYKTQKEFAEFLEIKRVQYNKYENNKEQPTLETLYRISLKLDMKMEDIIYLG